jgi:hypothetical protein
MKIVLPVLAVAFAAFCVWLGVWVYKRHKNRGWRFWTVAALVAMFVVYPLSLGPACWLLTQEWKPDATHAVVVHVYAPILWVYRHGPQSVHAVIRSYAFLWSRSAPPSSDDYIHL